MMSWKSLIWKIYKKLVSYELKRLRQKCRGLIFVMCVWQSRTALASAGCKKDVKMVTLKN